MITCKLCGKKVKDVGSLSRHRSKDHPGSYKKKTIKASSPKQYAAHGQESEILAEIEENVSRLGSLLHELRKVKSMGL